MQTPEGSFTSTSRRGEDDGDLQVLFETAERCRARQDADGEQKAYASLLVAARVEGHDRYTAEALHGLGGVLLRKSEFEPARVVLSQAVTLWAKLEEESRAADAGARLGIALHHGSDHGGAHVQFRRALERFHGLGDPEGVARCTSWLGVLAAQLSDFQAAMKYQLDTLRIGEELDDDRVRGAALNSLGLVHWKLGEPEEATRCFERSLAFRRTLEDPDGEADVLSNLGMLCDERGDREAALEHYFRSLEARGESDRNPNRANTLQNIGNTYLALEAFDLALDYNAQALEIRERLGGAPLAGSYQNLGALHLEMGNLQEAREHLERAQELAEKYELPDEQQMILELRAKCSERAGDLEEALAHQRRAHAQERALFGAETARRIAELRTQYEAEQKERETEIFRLQNVELVEANQKLEAALATARNHARSDSLTGLSNRREMLERIQDEIDRSGRYGRVFSLVLLDLDGFKRVNDVHGHATGDALLLAVADLLRSETRIEDRVARWGGDEFLVLLPETDGEGAVVFAERYRSLLEDRVLEWQEERIRITVSAGVSTFFPGDSITACVKRADEALYVSKASGRNRVSREPNP